MIPSLRAAFSNRLGRLGARGAWRRNASARLTHSGGKAQEGMSQAKVGPSTNKLRGFIEYGRHKEPWREPLERIRDFGEVHLQGGLSSAERNAQSARCMDCGTPFCQSDTGCPLGNLIPEFNDLVHKQRWKEALARLHKTNNFPEFTGAVCPAPCESACVAGIPSDPVTIKDIERAIVDQGWEQGWIKPAPPLRRTGLSVGVVGSGPAGLAAADELNKQGHTVTVYERDDRPGGLLTYGIPNMKLDKRTVERRLGLMEAEGVRFEVNANVGSPEGLPVEQLMDQHHALVLAVGATKPRDLQVEGRQHRGIHFAMEFLTETQKHLFMSRDGMLDSVYGRLQVEVQGRDVVVIGGGDTGTDCIATSLRRGCRSVTNIEIVEMPPPTRAADNPWPQNARVFKMDYGHEEAAAVFGHDPRLYRTMTLGFEADETGSVSGVRIAAAEPAALEAGGGFAPVAGTEKVLPAQLVILALGFERPETTLSDALGLARDARGNMTPSHGQFGSSLPGVFVAGDCKRGQSLVVWAIDEGRRAASEVGEFLSRRVAEAGGAVPTVSAHL